MAAQVMCLTSSGGIPLFSRQKGDKEMVRPYVLYGITIVCYVDLVSNFFMKYF